jgi:glucan phosphoethanolaminetransferase (alkaline phosphatase superfamily)
MTIALQTLAMTNEERGEAFGQGIVLLLAFVAALVCLVVYIARRRK